MATPSAIRLSLDRADITLFLQHPLLAAPPRRRRLHQTYFDTAKNDFAQCGLTVYETRILRKTTLTVQQAHARKNTGNVLQEWSGVTTPGAFDFATLIDAPETAETLSQFASALTPLFSVDVSQRQWTVQIRSAHVEVILEDGTLKIADTATQRGMEFCEVELRLINGQPAALYGVARLLSRQLRLHPVHTPLLARAAAFRTDETAKPVKARRIKIDPKSSTIAVFKHVAWQCLDQLQDNENGSLALITLNSSTRRASLCAGCARHCVCSTVSFPSVSATNGVRHGAMSANNSATPETGMSSAAKCCRRLKLIWATIRMSFS